MAIWLQCVGAVCLLSFHVSLATRRDRYVSPLPSAVDEMESMFRSNFVAEIRAWQEFALHIEITSMAVIFPERISSAFISDEPLLLCTIVSPHLLPSPFYCHLPPFPCPSPPTRTPFHVFCHHPDFWTTKCVRCPGALDALEALAAQDSEVIYISLNLDDLEGAREIVSKG